MQAAHMLTNCLGIWRETSPETTSGRQLLAVKKILIVALPTVRGTANFRPAIDTQVICDAAANPAL
jgi:hypothetical protein